MQLFVLHHLPDHVFLAELPNAEVLHQNLVGLAKGQTHVQAASIRSDRFDMVETAEAEGTKVQQVLAVLKVLDAVSAVFYRTEHERVSAVDAIGVRFVMQVVVTRTSQ